MRNERESPEMGKKRIYTWRLYDSHRTVEGKWRDYFSNATFGNFEQVIKNIYIS